MTYKVKYDLLAFTAIPAASFPLTARSQTAQGLDPNAVPCQNSPFTGSLNRDYSPLPTPME